MKVQFNNLNEQWKIIKNDTLPQIDNLFERSNFILGDAVVEFEDLFKEYIACDYAVGVSNGTDALKLAAESLDIHNSVLVIAPANTFVATVIGIEQALPKADFTLIDCDEYFQMDLEKLEQVLASSRQLYSNVIIVPVHLYGYMCDMTSLMKLSLKYDCLVIEDASQAHGAKWEGQPVGSFGDVSAFSLYPGKNLGAAGDAGIVTTNNHDIYERLLRLRNLGSIKKYEHEIKGGNHRLDTIQAIILKEKMKHIEDWNACRREIVRSYEDKINNSLVQLPQTKEGCLPVHHIYPVVVSNRESFTNHLDENGIQWGFHYPICIEEMPMYKELRVPNKRSIDLSRHMVSLPIHPFMTEEEVLYLCETINQYKD